MLIGIVGAPNKGKSTLFSAMTMVDAEIANYPFTTINPNFGIAYATKPCVEKELGTKCNPRNSLCVNGTRMLPVNVVDVAGLVEGAHLGKGMGNQFLNDLANADALIIVADSSGGTDQNGNQATSSDPVKDVEIVINEITEWFSSIIKRNISASARKADGLSALAGALTGIGATRAQIEAAAASSYLSLSNITWTDEDVKSFAASLLKINKPMVIAANKSDSSNAGDNKRKLEERFGKEKVFACSAAIELALRKAAKQGLIDYRPGDRDFNVLSSNLSAEQADAIAYMQRFVRENGSGVQELVNHIVFDVLDNIVVYPVEDDSKYSDHFGNVLPDAILIKKGSTAQQLAYKIHTDLGDGMLYAIDAKTKVRLAKNYILNDNDVVKIVSAAKKK
ncbi:MAG: redox-regulated ATPase YchF [Candidatus Micrarchaeia archaeon]